MAEDRGERTALGNGGVDVWSVSLLVPFAPPRLDAILSASEADALRRMAPGRRVRMGAAWAARRLLIARYAGCAPVDVRFARPAGRAPVLAWPDRELRFSFSHSYDRALLALSTFPVGVDIERVDRAVDCVRLAARFDANGEAEFLRSLPAAARSEAFARLWTRKEAVLKAAGGGVPSRLRRVSVPLGPADGSAAGGSATSEGPLLPEPWFVRDLVAPPNYAAALATPAPARVRQMEFDLLRDDADSAGAQLV